MKRSQIMKSAHGLLLKIILLLFPVLFIATLPGNGFAQQITAQVICSGGETFVSTNYSLDFAIGEITTESFANNNLILSQGFIQSLEAATGVDEKAIDEKDIVVYPNPSANHAYLLCNAETKPVKVDIRDIHGKTILSRDFNTNPMLIKLNELQSGFYTMAILFENHQTINKKIIKK